jgi:hypothetical protein
LKLCKQFFLVSILELQPINFTIGKIKTMLDKKTNSNQNETPLF